MRGNGGIALRFLTSALDEDEWLASRRFTPGERAPCTHWIGGWVGPRTSLHAVEKSFTLPGNQPEPPSP
jgi:hypothetical protein